MATIGIQIELIFLILELRGSGKNGIEIVMQKIIKHVIIKIVLIMRLLTVRMRCLVQH